MKKLSLTILVLLAVFLLSGVTGVSAVGGKLIDRLVFYVHVAQLYTKDADRTLAMPLQDVSTKQVSNTWHAARDGNRLHQGQDIFAPRGTPVFSATEGYVVNIGENSLGGRTVSVIGAGGRVYYYAHLEAYAPNVSERDWVTKETVLGYVGTTGNAAGTPPHLHFGIYAPPRSAINPLPLLHDRPATIKPPAEAKSARTTKRR